MFKTRKMRPAPVPPAEAYSSSDVARLAGISLRQLQWWDERQWCRRNTRGHKRIYSAEQVVEVTVIGGAFAVKASLSRKIRRVLRYLQREMGRRLGDVLPRNRSSTCSPTARPSTSRTTTNASSIS